MKPSRSAFTLIEIMIVVAIIGLLAAIAVPAFHKAIVDSQTRACTMNQKSIDGAKLRWALENHKPDTAVPVDKDLFGEDRLIEQKPECPASGTYTIGAVKERCSCSLPEHTR